MGGRGDLPNPGWLPGLNGNALGDDGNPADSEQKYKFRRGGL